MIVKIRPLVESIIHSDELGTCSANLKFQGCSGCAWRCCSECMCTLLHRSWQTPHADVTGRVAQGKANALTPNPASACGLSSHQACHLFCSLIPCQHHRALIPAPSHIAFQHYVAAVHGDYCPHVAEVAMGFGIHLWLCDRAVH